VGSIIHRGPYDGVAAARAALLRWVEAADLVAAGPMRTLYLAFGAEPELRVPPGWVVASAEEFVTELQLPVG
jgi:effector-binding domain-containing protein